MKHPIQEMMDRRRQGKTCGIPSYCTANPLVLEIILKRAKLLNTPVLIEATANQVNQYGGYTGMLPRDFHEMIQQMAKEINLPEHLVILGGDHLGPLTWQTLPEQEAMEKSIEMVYQYARAGFTKIHLDTSMKVADDPEGLLSTETIARRGAKLYKAAMKGSWPKSPAPCTLSLSSAARFPFPAEPRRQKTAWPSPARQPSGIQ